MKAKRIIADCAGGILAAAGLFLVVGECPGAGAAAFAALKICGGALLWGAYKVLDGVHPEWREEEV